MAALRLRVNGVTRELECPPETPLLWALRDELALTGTKYGCGIAQCGACTVHLDGRAVRSCSISITRAGDSDIVTIEGLSPDGSHPVQRAWRENGVPQCGYCQAGQIMQAAALLAQRPRPTEAQVVAGMQGVLCRCGTYARIRRAVLRASELARSR